MADDPARRAPDASVQQLHSDTGGLWLVTTVGSRHIWDLDQHTYTRLPGEASERFPWDGCPVTLTRVERWPAVGATSLLTFDDPDDPEHFEQWRQSSTIRSIERLDPAERDGQPQTDDDAR